MTHSMRWSNISAPCRLEWRPSSWAIAALLTLAMSAPIAVIGSEMPRALAWPLSIVALGYGAWLARREWAQPGRAVVWPPGVEPITINDVPVHDVHLQWRGPLAFLRWRDNDACVRRLVWWPDTLPAMQRRELKLAAQARESAQATASMAP